MFIPTTPSELQQLGWDQLDVILITGDSYVDSPFIGIAVIGKILLAAGYRVGIIGQPDVDSDDITRLGEPKLFWGVTGGAIDSMVANYTATKRPKKSDDMTSGGQNDRRPNRAAIVYPNLIRRNFKNTVPIVLGGVEASLRRVVHYDFWSDSLRKSILFNAKADILIYGMADQTILDLAAHLKSKGDYRELRGICYISPDPNPNYLELPSYDEVVADKNAFIDMFHTFYQNNDPLTAQGLCQRQDGRYLIQNPPADHISQAALDRIHALGYERAQHPFHAQQGAVKALDTIRYSVASHRGCYGECNFCSIAVHQGRTVQWRSEGSILTEVREIAQDPDFKGIVTDIGGPTANMYGFECQKKLKSGVCDHKRCLSPEICPALKIDHGPQRRLLQKLRKIKGVKKIFVGSGVRYDMVLADQKQGFPYLQDVIRNHTSGQMKIAPEHTENRVLKWMGKPGKQPLTKFRDLFYQLTERANKKQFLTYYLIAAHPGCTDRDMDAAKRFASQQLKINPEQVQIFTPLPSTYSTLMYYTEMDPFTREPIFVEKNIRRKEKQKEILTAPRRTSRPKTGPPRPHSNRRPRKKFRGKKRK
jgi:uncharacterized radical SAM protein YgiQ